MVGNIGRDSRRRNRAMNIARTLGGLLAAILVSAGLAAGLTGSALADTPKPPVTPWKEFAFPEDGFAITGPSAAPRVAEQPTDSGSATHGYTFKSGTIGAAFLVKVTRNSASRGDNEQKLREISAHNPRVMKAMTQAGMEGVQFGFEDTDTSSIGRIFATEHMIYTILAQGPVGQYPPVALNRWLDSFRLLDTPLTK